MAKKKATLPKNSQRNWVTAKTSRAAGFFDSGADSEVLMDGTPYRERGV
ncbi:MAG: hypothetical protein VXY78_07560 [Pseudomonadota bacterium]|jgi:hypothetical protein|nr:hypothetical protein [Pseudomonadota bacterium]